jgi:hypothetical protein
MQAQAETVMLKGRAIDKIAKFGWLSRNEPGKLQYLPKDSLRVDSTYQRAVNLHKQRRIASQFNWAAFGVLIVARRSNGSLWVIDGQHRLMAAQSRSDVRDVPTIIFEFGDNVKDEATDFLIANKDRRPLSGVDSFKAMVVSGDPIALEVQEMIFGAGRVVSEAATVSSKVRCVKAIYNCMVSDVEAMRRAWPLIVELVGDGDVDSRLVVGMHWLEGHIVDPDGRRRSLVEAETRRKLLGVGCSAIIRSIGDAAAYYHRGGQVVYARGIIKVVNHKRRIRLMMIGDREVTPA